MIKLRKILLCNYLYFILLLFVLLLVFIRIKEKNISNYSSKDNTFMGTITSLKINGDLLSLKLKDKNGEFVQASYYFSNEYEKKKYQNYFFLGDKLKIRGEFTSIKNATTENIFDYKEYSERNKLFYSINISSIIKIAENKNIFFFMKNILNHYFTTFNNRKYLSLFLLGDKTFIKKDVLTSFRNNGISHLFAISGMHIALISSFILKFFSLLKVSEEKRYFITCLILFIYLILTGATASVMRAFLFFLLFTINKIYYFHIDNVYIFILTVSIVLLINPYYIYDVAFQYTFLISFTLILSGKYINKYKNYFIKLLITSLFSFLISLPITTYHFYQINFLSIIYNLFYVPFVTIILFPITFIILIFRPFEFIYDILIIILEKTSLYLGKIDNFTLIFGKIPTIFYFGYALLFLLFLMFYKKKILFLYFLLLLFHYQYYNIFDSDYLTMLDIGQGDSILMHSKNKNILIDTGGVMSFKEEDWRKKEKIYVTDMVTLPYLKSLGIKKLDYLLLTHGDFDHMGEALNILDNYKVEKVFINEGNINFLERNVIRFFSNVEVCYQNTYFDVGNFKYLSLNKDLKDENTSSIVLYVKIKNYKILLMGDANFKSEESIMKEYNLNHINILKLGHHGSKTSTKKEFLRLIKPDIALISAGRSNKFNHPNKETIERLKDINVKYYSTKKSGTITINFSKNSIEY